MDKNLLNHILLCVIEETVTIKEIILKTGEREQIVKKAIEKLVNLGLLKQNQERLIVGNINEQIYIQSISAGISVLVLNLIAGSKKLDKEKIGRNFITG